MPSTWVSETPDTEIPGYLSTVHHNALEVNLWAGVPDKAAMANGFLAFMVFIGTSIGWRWIPVAVIIHGLLALVTYGDPRRIEKYLRSLRFKGYYAPGIRQAPSSQRFKRYYLSNLWNASKPTKASRYEDYFLQLAQQDPVIVQAEWTIEDLDRALANHGTDER